MEAAEEVVDTEIGDCYTEEGADAIDMQAQAAILKPTETAVECGAVNKHRYQRPHLFRIPAPETPPGLICPDCSDKYTGSKREYRRIQQPAVDDCHCQRAGNRRYRVIIRVIKVIKVIKVDRGNEFL